MQQHPSGSPESDENSLAPDPTGPAPRPLRIRDLEARDREEREQMERAERRERTVRWLLVIVVLAVLGTLAVSWLSLRAQLEEAGRDLDVVRVTAEEQVTEILRYAPLPRTRGAAGRREVDTALVAMASPDPSKRVAGVHAARAITRRRFPIAKARVQQEFRELYEDFQLHHEDTEAVIRERSKGYQKAAAAYNQAAAAFPGTLVRSLLGMPQKLPQLKP